MIVQVRNDQPGTPVFKVYQGTFNNLTLYSDGSVAFAGDKCGFTSDGEIYFMSRSTRYKIVVSNGICQAEEFSKARELKEKVEQLIADKRETKPSPDPDPQGEVTMDNDNAS